MLSLLCFPFPARERCTKVLLKYYYGLAVGLQYSFTALLRKVLPSIAVHHSLVLGCSVLQTSPKLVSQPGEVLPTRDACANNNKKTHPVQRLCFICFDWEREALLSSTWFHKHFSSVTVENDNSGILKIRSILVILHTRNILAESSDYFNITLLNKPNPHGRRFIKQVSPPESTQGTSVL